MASAAVFTEMFDLNLRDELRDGIGLSSREMHAAFVRALHFTACDMPITAGPDPEDVASSPNPAPTRHRALGYLMVTAKAAVIATLIRVTIFFGTGF